MLRLLIVIFVPLLVTLSSARYIEPHNSLNGTINSCSNEGEEVKVDLVAQNPCFHCICRSGSVECGYTACPSLKGCHAILFTRTPGLCCDQCKGCSVNGKRLAHGEVRKDTKNPCDVMMCQAGVLTKSRDICKPQCSNPMNVPGQCCPSCSGCYFEGKNYKSGQNFTSTYDKGLECSCMGGNITCSKRVCPVLNCPLEYLYKVPGKKCPQCKGQRRVYTLRESCYFARKVYQNEDVSVLDSCTSCVCQQGTMYCERQQCPEIQCPPSERISTQGECCPRCKQRPSCKSAGKVYQHGEKWRERHCTDCQCDNGKKWCHAVRCHRIEKCALGYKLARPRGECCDKCIKDEKTCAVYGPKSDVFKTFDGRRYNMSESPCKFTLLKDCYQHQIDVKIRYKPNKQGTHLSISQISIVLGKHSIKLSRNFKIRVNRTKLSYNRYTKSGTVGIRVNFPRVIVQDKSKGIRIIWHINSNLKVKIDRRYRKSGRLCGLCGNFNGHKGDDFINQKGALLKTSKQMAAAWSLKKSCIAIPKKRKLSPIELENEEYASSNIARDVTTRDKDHLSRT